MIIKISDDGLSVRWSHDSTMNTQNWQYADINDLINAYEKNMDDNMQRLIDADKLIKENHVLIRHFPKIEYKRIEDTPTVEAIPIEWIKEWANNYCDWNQEQLIECLLRTWNKMGEEKKDAKSD